MGQVTSVSQEEFEEKVLNSSKPVLVRVFGPSGADLALNTHFQFLMK